MCRISEFTTTFVCECTMNPINYIRDNIPVSVAIVSAVKAMLQCTPTNSNWVEEI